MGMIVEVQRKINEGDISHPTINRDHISPSGGRSTVDVDFHSIAHLSIAEVGVVVKP
jgi:hypothetical protein